MRLKTTVYAVAALTLAAVGVPASASAGTATTPVGTLTAYQHTQYPCEDLGARVVVNVAHGFANTRYSLSESGYWHVSAAFTTNASGSGTAELVPVEPLGIINGAYATITATANGKSGQVTAYVYCQSSKGD